MFAKQLPVGYDKDGKPVYYIRGKFTGEIHREIPPLKSVSSEEGNLAGSQTSLSSTSGDIYYSAMLPPPDKESKPISSALQKDTVFRPMDFFQGSWIWHTGINADNGISIDNLSINGYNVSGTLTLTHIVWSMLYKASWVSRIPKQTIDQLFDIHKQILSGEIDFLQYQVVPDIKVAEDFYKLSKPITYIFKDTLTEPEKAFRPEGMKGINPNHFSTTILTLSKAFNSLTEGKPIIIVYRDHDMYTGVDGKGKLKKRNPGEEIPYNNYLEIFLGKTYFMIREGDTPEGKSVKKGAGKRKRKNKTKKKKTKKRSKKRSKSKKTY